MQPVSFYRFVHPKWDVHRNMALNSFQCRTAPNSCKYRYVFLYLKHSNLERNQNNYIIIYAELKSRNATPPVSLVAIHLSASGSRWHLEHKSLWKWKISRFLNSSCNSVFVHGTWDDAAASKIESGKTFGLVEFKGGSLRAIISRNFQGNSGLGYNSMSLTNKKWVTAASRAIFRATFIGYGKLFFVLYIWPKDPFL